MDEHDDDLEAEVEEGVEFEKEEFPALEEDNQGTEVSSEKDTSEIERDLDPDDSEI
jgi:hypothetical protein